jgi:hypothetical protein
MNVSLELFRAMQPSSPEQGMATKQRRNHKEGSCCFWFFALQSVRVIHFREDFYHGLDGFHGCRSAWFLSVVSEKSVVKFLRLRLAALCSFTAIALPTRDAKFIFAASLC